MRDTVCATQLGESPERNRIKVENMTKTIDIAKDFSRFPSGRYPEHGEGNATAFREKFLVPILENDDSAIVILDGVVGYPASFLDEAFAGLIKKEGYPAKKVLDSFEFRATEPGFILFEHAINEYLDSAAREAANDAKS